MEKKRRIGILGAGAWGTAMAKVVGDKGYPISLWCFEKEVADSINRNHVNERYLPGISLPKTIVATTDITKAADGMDFILIATPSFHTLETIKKILSIPNIMEGRSLIGVLSKGFIPTVAKPGLIIEILENYLPGFYKNNLVYISGPSHAEEVSQGKITGLISASMNGKNSIRFRQLLSGTNLIVFSSFDVIGVQVSAALKNVIAIAFGMFDALKELSPEFGDNTESLLLAAGLNEIQLLGQAMGSTYPETFSSIAGVGDLDVTCRSKYGRNRRFGREIILEDKISGYRNIEDLIANISQLGYYPEGIFATKYARALYQEFNLRLLITECVYQILNRNENPLEAIEKLLKSLTKGTPVK
ncbi:MAG: NAD(P)-dependent glycerol-3-phosphate dehydrogenase [Spirochaetales bacterium]|nr:NAD(P)-dependent glycerol-3-phosphate dehydrogenase [Spirochaetales bacterium]